MLFVVRNCRLEKEQFVAQAINENVVCSDNTTYLVSNYVNKIIESIKVLRDSEEIYEFINSREDSTENEVIDLFIKTLNNKSNYKSISFIDTDGFEVMNVFKYNESYVAKPQEYFRNIKGNVLYNELINSEDNTEVFLSSLNIKRVKNNMGESELDTTLSFLIPVYDSTDTLAGMISIDYSGNDLLSIANNYSTFERNSNSFLSVYSKEGNGDYAFKEGFNLNQVDDDSSIVKSISNSLLPHITEESGTIIDGNSLTAYFDVLSGLKDSNLFNGDKLIMSHAYNLRQIYSIEKVLSQLFTTVYFIYLLVIIVAAYILSYYINKSRKNEDELNVAHRVADNTTDAVIIGNIDKNIQFVNKSIEESTGYKVEELCGKSPTILISDLNSPEKINTLKKEIAEKYSWNGAIWKQDKRGILYASNLNLLYINHKRPGNNYIALFSSLTNSQVRTRQNMIQNSQKGLIEELLTQAIARGKSKRYILLYIALENFNILVDLFTKENLVIMDKFIDLLIPFKGEFDVIAKAGRNNVVCIFDADAIDCSLQSYVTSIYKSLSKIMYIGDNEVFFKSKIGVSIYPDDTDDFSQLFDNTVMALQWSTTIGEKNVVFFSPAMRLQLNREKTIERNLRMAIDKKELFMVYQPQVDINSGKVVGMEALLRWNCEELGYVSPAVFIPIAEKNRMMIDLGKWILERTCSDLGYILKKLGDSDLRCAINISVVQLEDTDFLENFYNVIEKNHLKYSNIEIEITENLFLEQSPNTSSILQDIKDRGITIAIDDFGTGYSSLSYLNRLPVDKIKIDRGFIKNYPSADSGELAKILVNMSKTLNKDVLTEGAETEDQIQYLKSIGCEYIQGYYFSKPLMIDDLISYVNRD